MSPRAIAYCLVGAILLVTAATYAQTLKYDFTNWDDPAYVSQNPDVQSPSLRSVIRILSPRTRVASEWSPVVTLSHLIEQVLFGGGPRVAHAGNLLLHLACAGLVWGLLRAYGAPLSVTVPGTLLFALHPLQVESVAWVAGRKTLLATSLSLGALLLFQRPFRSSLSWAGLGLTLLALASKATAVVLPVWILASGWLLDRAKLRRQAPWVATMLGLALVRGLLTLQFQEAATQRASEMGLLARLEIAGPVLLTYFGQLVWPADLCAYYGWSAPGSWGLGAWVAVAGFCVLVAWMARGDRRLALFGLFAATALLPTMNFIPAPYFQADRYLYPVMPAVAYLAPALLLRLPRIPDRAGAMLISAAILALVPVTHERIAVWRGARALWQDTLACAPAFAAGWSNLGLAEAEAARPEAALRAFRRAREVDPNYLAGYANEGELLARMGRLDEAERALRAGLARGEDPNLLNNLAWLLHERRPAEAAALASRAVEMEPRHAPAWDTLGAALLEQGDADGARRALERGVAIGPHLPDLHYHLAEALEALGRTEAAARHARRSLELLEGRPAPWAERARRLAP
jgi:tetratricopeptide (TPR) repeat protein